MRFKVDENLGRREAALLRSAAHDVKTVIDQDLCSESDFKLIEVCRTEGLCLITLDVQFGNPLLFKPSDYRGIALLRLGARIRPEDIEQGLRTLIRGLENDSIDGKLWIVQPGRIRIYQEEPPEQMDFL